LHERLRRDRHLAGRTLFGHARNELLLSLIAE